MADLSSYSFLVLFLILATSECNIESTAEVTDDENLRKLATANNVLAVNIYRQLTNGYNGNVFFSPLSLSTAFGMLYYGTRGHTAEELRNALGYDRAGLEEGLVHQTFRKYLTEVLPSQDTWAYTLRSANAVLLSNQLDLVPEYKTDVQDHYRTSVTSVDFATQGPELVRDVNDWVREETNGKIDKLLDELDPSARMVLLNAVYFKGTWKTQFNTSDTIPWNFFNYGLESGKTTPPVMRLVEEFLYAEVDDFKVLEMPYRGDNVSMILLMPNEEDDLESLERSLSPTILSELRSRLVERRVHLYVPQFKLEFSRELSGAFRAAGAREVFTPAADFSGITQSSGNIRVSQVLHKAVIEVKEAGSEAAAATGMVTSGALPHVFVNYPFLFAIIDRRNDMILFMGRVTNL